MENVTLSVHLEENDASSQNRNEIREYWRNASKRYYQKHRDIVKAKRLAHYHKQMENIVEPKLEVENKIQI